MKGNERNAYTFMKQGFDFADGNPELVAPAHAALYFWLIQLNNSLKWKEKFGVPTYDSMAKIGIRNYKTYKKAFDDLQKWGFIKLVEKAQNQHTSNIIALVFFTKASPKQVQSTAQSTATIVKPLETTETGETPIKGLAEKIFDLFIDVHGNYFVLDTQQRESELAAAQTLIDLFEKTTPGLTEAQTLEHFRQYFANKCINTPDKWLREKMSLPIIVKYFNRINSAAENPGGGATNQQIASIIAKNFGSDSSYKNVNGQWERDIPKPGTSPDLSGVDSTNRLNEQ